MATQKNTYSSFLSDRPVGVTNDLLWHRPKRLKQTEPWPGDVISGKLDDFANSIVSPLLDKTQHSTELSSSLTFAINGKWGAGKSSALKMIKEKARDLLAGSKKISPDHLKFCEYMATRYEAHSYDARVTLALQIITALAGSTQKAAEEFLPEALGVTQLGQLLPQGWSEAESRNSVVLERVAATLSELIDFDSIVKKHLQEEDGTPRVLVVLVDDLDRCKVEFRWRLLDAIQQLSDIPNLFFVLAVDLDRLREAVEQTGDGVDDPDFALEKYIQGSVTLPDMDREGFKSFVERLLQEFSAKDPAARTIVENVQFLQNGLKEVTPRSVKRCINTIRSDLRRQVSGEVSDEERQQYLKERMLEYTWPAFHRKYFRPAKFPATIDEERLRRAFGTLETACMELAHNRDEMLFNFTLKRISETYHLEWEALDRRLISFLGIPPYWFTSTEKPLSVFSQLEPEWPPVKAQNQPPKEPTIPVLEDPTDEFTRLYLRGEIAEANGNREETLRYAQDIYDLITQHRSYFQSQHADSVGNVAINAERFNDINLAASLYELALELNPQHSNNMQNYADLIVMRPVPSRYDRAKELIERLKRPPHAQHRLERTLSLEAHLKAAMGGEPARIGSGELEKLIVDFLEGPTQRKFVGLMSLLTEIQDYADMDPISHAFFQAATTDEDRYLAIRAFADGLAPSKVSHYEALAMDIYRHLLSTTLSSGAMAERPQVQHNLATLLYRHDYDDEAGRLWFEAYNSVPKNGAIQRAYELYLLRAGRPDLANDVAEGKPLKEMALQEGTKPIPRQFFDADIDRWWEPPILP